MKVLAYCIHGNLSYAILKGLADALARSGDDVRWYFPQTNQHLFDPAKTRETIKKAGLEIAHKGDFKPDVILHTDHRAAPRDWGDCLVVEVPHGLASKVGYYLPGTKMDVDVHLAASEWYSDRIHECYPKAAAFPCGMPKLDPFAHLPRPAPGEGELLYCPTFTPCLTSWSHLMPGLQVLAEERSVAVRAHRAMLEIHDPRVPSGIRRDSCTDICLSFSKAEVVVSDCSSAWIEAMGLGLPVVCYVTPGNARYLDKRPESTEAVFLEHAEVIYDAEELPDAIDRAKPAPLEVQDQILGHKGGSIERCMEVIHGL